jgi:hypothetical protein
MIDVMWLFGICCNTSCYHLTLLQRFLYQSYGKAGTWKKRNNDTFYALSDTCQSDICEACMVPANGLGAGDKFYHP